MEQLKDISLRLKVLLKGDKVIWAVIAFLGLTSVLTVYSSSHALAMRYGASPEDFLLKHIILLMVAVGVVFIFHRLNFSKLSKLSVIFLVLSILLLLYTYMNGVTYNHATRWIRVPFIGITFQTSDFAKIALIMYVARTLSIMQSKEVSIHELLIPIFIVTVLIIPSDLSSALILLLTCIILMFIAKAPFKVVLYILVAGFVAVSIVMMFAYFNPEAFRLDTWSTRLAQFWNGQGGNMFQVEQAQMAIAKGGFFGLGPGNAEQAHFLPHSYSDYIYCVIIEEYGLLGGSIVCILYVTLLIRCIRMITKSPKAFGAILAFGLCLSITIQAFVHMAVNVNLLPVTGLTLPLVSMGGTSLMFTGMSLGIILSVSRYIENNSQNTNSKIAA